MSVIDLAAKRAEKDAEQEQTGTGAAFCIACRHTWVVTAPTGTTSLECPECHTMKGRFKFIFGPPEGEMVWECNCGNRLFCLTPEGHLCVNCGIYQSY